jgi:hypothetical protein
MPRHCAYRDPILNVRQFTDTDEKVPNSGGCGVFTSISLWNEVVVLHWLDGVGQAAARLN